MSFHFRSLRSSSSGNCLMLWTQTTRILLDCGIKTYSGCVGVLREHTEKLDGVLVSHAHGDHICRHSLRALAECGAPIHCHRDIITQIHGKHSNDGDWVAPLRGFCDDPFEIGDLTIQPVQVPHAPGYLTFGFVVWCGEGRDRRKAVICTDFNHYGSLIGQLADADFVFIEANHDPDLLRKHPNFASRFHLSNPKAAQLLCEARTNGGFAPQAVMLGHLSHQRNTDPLAIAAIRDTFQAQGLDLEFRLEVAPRDEPSIEICIE